MVEVDKDKRRIRLSMKQLEPTSADVFISEHAVGETLMGRVIEVHGNSAKIELAEGVHSRCKTQEEPSSQAAAPLASDVQDLAAMLSSRWKGGAGASAPEGIKPGQIRSFKITAIDAPNKRIDIEIAE